MVFRKCSRMKVIAEFAHVNRKIKLVHRSTVIRCVVQMCLRYCYVPIAATVPRKVSFQMFKHTQQNSFYQKYYSILPKDQTLPASTDTLEGYNEERPNTHLLVRR